MVGRFERDATMEKVSIARKSGETLGLVGVRPYTLFLRSQFECV